MHVLLAAHPAPDAPPHVLAVAAHTESPGRAFDMSCWVVGCGCPDSFPLRPVDPQDAIRALVAVASHGQEGANGGPSSPTAAEQVAAGFRNLADAQEAAQAISGPNGSGPIAPDGSVTEPRRTASDPGVFELHPSGGGFSWRLRDEHGDEVAVGKLYDGRDEARAAIDTVVRRALGGGDTTAQVVEVAS